jgi:hypothetical protein
MRAGRPLSLSLADSNVQDIFLHTLDCEATSQCGAVRLRVMRSRDTAARVFLCVDRTATGERIDSVLLDKSQATYLRDGITRAVGSLKSWQSVVLRGVQFSAREATRVATALNVFITKG